MSSSGKFGKRGGRKIDSVEDSEQGIERAIPGPKKAARVRGRGKGRMIRTTWRGQPEEVDFLRNRSLPLGRKKKRGKVLRNCQGSFSPQAAPQWEGEGRKSGLLVSRAHSENSHLNGFEEKGGGGAHQKARSSTPYRNNHNEGRKK